MKLSIRDTNPGAFAVRVQCIRCGRWRQLADTVADLDGPAFKAYFCYEHPPTSEADATEVYRHA